MRLKGLGKSSGENTGLEQGWPLYRYTTQFVALGLRKSWPTQRKPTEEFGGKVWFYRAIGRLNHAQALGTFQSTPSFSRDIIYPGSPAAIVVGWHHKRIFSSGENRGFIRTTLELPGLHDAPQGHVQDTSI